MPKKIIDPLFLPLSFHLLKETMSEDGICVCPHEACNSKMTKYMSSIHLFNNVEP